LDREYLENYQAKEIRDYEAFKKKIEEERFDFEKHRYPSNERFENIQEPVAHACGFEAVRERNIWAQIPFCGSLLVDIAPLPKPQFEEIYFKASQIPKIIDFIKETGKLQVALSSYPLAYQGHDYLDPIFEELEPPYFGGLPNLFFGNAKDIEAANESFMTLAKLGYLDLLKKMIGPYESLESLFSLVNKSLNGYIRLKLTHRLIAEEIENLMVDNPIEAYFLLNLFRVFVTDSVDDLRSVIRNLTLNDAKMTRVLPAVYQIANIRFPCEIGKFLMRKLTYAPQGLRACNELIDHYDVYDLQRVQRSLNEGIVDNQPDTVNKNAEELSEILDNVWSDKTIPRRVKDLQIGVPLFMAAMGAVAAGPIGATGGFLAGLGYDLVEKTIDLNTEGLSERLAKLKTKSYQASIYDFKKKYKHRIRQE